MASTTALILGGLSAAGAFGSAEVGSDAAKSAAQTQSDSAEQALQFQEGVYGDQKTNQAPFLAAGQQSVGQLMNDISSGKYGTGSTPAFTAPTAAEAEATPGYQFTQQQGDKGILEGASGLGGSVSGGTLKAVDQYNSGLASSTYQQTYNNSLSTYQQNLANQNQEFSQLYNTAALGEGSANAINNSGTAAATNIGNLMTQQGNSQAAGTVGSANAISGGIGSATNGVLNSYLLSKLVGPGPTGPSAVPNYGPATPAGYNPATYSGSGSTTGIE